MATISRGMAQDIYNKLMQGKSVSSTNAYKFKIYMDQGGGGFYGAQKANASSLLRKKYPAFYNTNINKAYSGSSIIKPSTRNLAREQADYAKQKNRNKVAAPPAPPAPSSQAGLSGGYDSSGSYGGALPPVNPTPQIPVNIELYKLRDAAALMKEAGVANKAVYDPKYKGLETLIGQLGLAQDASEKDRESQFNAQVGDLQRIYGTLNQQFTGAQGAVGQGYEQAAKGIQAATDQGLSQQGQNFTRASQMLADMSNVTGMGNWSQQGQADLGRDNSFTQALLNNSNQNAQSMNSLAKGAADTWLTSLNEGTKAQGAMQSGQARLARDQDIRSIEQEYLGKNMEAQQNLYNTQSQSAADLYELVRGMQSEDWTKYMDTREAAFGQQYQNAGLLQQGQALSLEKAQLEQQALLAQLQAATGSGSEGSQQTRLDQAINYLGEAMKDPKELEDAQYVLRLLMNPRKINSDISNAAGKVQGGESFLGLYGDDDAKKAQYGARLYQSMADRGYITGLNDPTWQAMQNALHILMTGTKKV